MVLLSLIGIGLGIHGISQIAKEPIQQYREKLIKERRGNVDIDIVCDYMNVKKKNGVYSIYDFEHISHIMKTQFYFKDEEVNQLKKQFDAKIKKQRMIQADNINDKYKELKNRYYSLTHGDIYIDDYFEVKHWHTLSKKEHEERINNIYKNTFWKDVALEPPYLIKDVKTVGYIEVWHIKKPRGFCNMKQYYNIAIQKLGY